MATLINPGEENLEQLRIAVDIMTAQINEPAQGAFAMSRAQEYAEEYGSAAVVSGLIVMSQFLLGLIEDKSKGKLTAPKVLQVIAAMAADSENYPPPSGE